MRVMYRSKRALVIHGDALKVLPRLEGKLQAHLIVTDPPYGVNFRSNKRTAALKRIENDHSTDVALRVLTAAGRLMHNHRHAYVFGKILWDDPSFPYTARTELVWDKVGMASGDFSLPWGSAHEIITFAYHSKSAANRARGDGNLAARLRQGSVLRVPRKNSRAVGRHPTEKPVPLLRRLIESSSMPYEWVLDPFAGSGSTAVAAVLEGRRCVCIEIDSDYCAVAVERVKEAEALATEMERL